MNYCSILALPFLPSEMFCKINLFSKYGNTETLVKKLFCTLREIPFS